MSADVGSATAVVVAGDEETRVLLRGLLRLHHFRVLGEAEGSTVAVDLVRSAQPTVLVADVNLAEGSFSSLVSDARMARPGLRVVLVAPSSRPQPAAVGPGAADAVLYRPFRIRQFAEALSPNGEAQAAPAGPTKTRP